VRLEIYSKELHHTRLRLLRGICRRLEIPAKFAGESYTMTLILPATMTRLLPATQPVFYNVDKDGKFR
jgi:hypothetical protein